MVVSDLSSPIISTHPAPAHHQSCCRSHRRDSWWLVLLIPCRGSGFLLSMPVLQPSSDTELVPGHRDAVTSALATPVPAVTPVEPGDGAVAHGRGCSSRSGSSWYLAQADGAEPRVPVMGVPSAGIPAEGGPGAGVPGAGGCLLWGCPL